MKHILFFTAIGFVLSGCAYTLDKPVQDITVTTPGAIGATCYAYVDGFRYKIMPPATLSVSRSREDLIITCKAPGNRDRRVVIEPELASSFILNASNLMLGAPVDELSGAKYSYPDNIQVSFEYTDEKAYERPLYERQKTKIPDSQGLEEIDNSVPRLNRDLGRPPVDLKRRGE